jgi:hypothetical protein
MHRLLGRRMTRLLGCLRARLTRLRMIRRGLLERDGTRYVLTSRGRALAGLLDQLDGPGARR